MSGSTILEHTPDSLTRPGDLVIVADAHIEPGSNDVVDFCAFLREREKDTALLVLLGDIFGLWLGADKYTLPHHQRVLEQCEWLRARGVSVVFVEGNREFGARAWEGRAFDRVIDRMSIADWGGRRWLLTHGDRLNPRDRSTRWFRAISRSRLVLGLFRLMPASFGLALGQRLERTMRTRNLKHKTSLPDARLARYAEWFAEEGFDCGVIGHLHVEKTIDLGSGDAARRLYVLPDWHTSRRFLRLDRDGQGVRFESWGGEREQHPVVVQVTEDSARVELTLDRPAALSCEQEILISSSHGGDPRSGVVLDVEPAGQRLVARVSAGPPIQVGDRVHATHDAG